jgi:transposase
MSHRPWINAGLKIAPENGCSFAALHMSACGTSRRFAATQSLSRRSFPFIERVFADAGYAGECVAGATSVALEIVRKAPDQIGFAVQPRRWVVERFFAWIGRNRRLAAVIELGCIL